MALNPVAELTQQLLDYFTLAPKNGKPPRFQRCTELVRHNIENAANMGDVTVSASSKIWLKYCRKHGLELRVDTEHLLENEQDVAELLAHAQGWRFPLAQSLPLRKERYALRFQRQPVIAHVLAEVLQKGSSYGQQAQPPDAPTICLLEQQLPGDVSELRYYRAHLLHNIIRRLLPYGKWRQVQPSEERADTLRVLVQCASQQPALSEQQSDSIAKRQVRVISGVVLEPQQKTASSLTRSDYLALRSNDMLLMAMHRHGVRHCANGRDDLMERLGAAAVIVDLFEVRHSSPATVVRSGLGCSKGAPYILYNSARLETLLRSFAAQVEAGVYEPLPPLERVDLSSLEDELDWQLIYGYLLGFPELVATSLDQLQQGHCSVHLIVRYIVGLASLFSRYYRNKQILVQQRAQLMPVLYARVYLVQAVRTVLNAALALLGIEPVDYM